MPRTLIVTNLATHYRRPLYLRLADLLDVRFIFYSDGGEWYWNAHDSGLEGLPARRLKGRWVGRTRITPGLVPAMLLGRYDVCLTTLNGKFVLPVTYLCARLRRKRWILWTGMWTHPTTRIHRLTRRPTRYLYRHADAVLTYGHHVSRFVIDEGADPSRVIAAPQAVDLQRFNQAGRAQHDGPIRIGYVGRLEPWKGTAVLLEALAILARLGVPFRAELAGEGTERPAYERQIEATGLGDAVALVGRIDNSLLPDFYRTQDIVVIPSIGTADVTETWSLVANEAMGCGCLVVATDAVGAAADGLVQEDVTGRVVAAGNAEALARALRECISDPSRLTRLRAAGHDAVQAYSYEAAADAFQRAIRLATSK